MRFFLSGIESKNKGLIMEINPFICDIFALGKVSCGKKTKTLFADISCILIKKSFIKNKRANKALQSKIGYPI